MPHPHCMAKVVDDTFVITKQNTAKHLFNTSTPRTLTSNSQLRNHLNRAHFCFWTPLSPQNPTNLHHISLQKTHTHRPIFTLGQQPLHNSKTKCIQHLGTQGKIVSSNQEALDQELLHIRKALQACQFPNWALNQLQQNYTETTNPTKTTNTTATLQPQHQQ